MNFMRKTINNAKKSFSLHMKEPGNTITHLIGAILSFVGLIYMLYEAVRVGSGLYLAGGLVFGLSLIALYSASTVYHWVPGSQRVNAVLRKIDHAMIYVLIAGTYTPICLITLKGLMGTLLLIGVWSLAVAGIVMKLLWMSAPRWLYTGCYLFLGWLAIFFILPIYKAMPVAGFICLVAGGLFYTVGSIIYAKKSEAFRLARLGFHEIFHLFILAGSAVHFLMISRFVLV
jgi:hemolysin III